ncbi:antibiotic biosynthesis monooxygenase family protein [Insolitispirillum peregrinum]
MMMFIAMNRFRIRKGCGLDFEAIWDKRESNLPEVPGFIEFHLVRGPEYEDHILYATHVLWDSRASFEAWTQSEAFRRSHAGARSSRDIYVGPPQFEGFEVLRVEKK